jgi:hypothetical protein
MRRHRRSRSCPVRVAQLPGLGEGGRHPPCLGRRGLIVGLLSACVIAMALPQWAQASSGALTYATVGQDQKHGAITGTVTWDQCTGGSHCWWAPFVMVGPVTEPCSVMGISEAAVLRGEASGTNYEVWGDGGWTENGTVKVSEIGFPATIGQQACLFVSYKAGSGDESCGTGRGTCVLLAARAFVLEQHPVSAAPTVPATSAPVPPTSAPPATTPQTAAHRKPTRAQRLRNALRQCRRRFHRRHRRILCERHARARYALHRHAG